MPIQCSQSLRFHDQEEFHAVDYKVMAHAFEIHNELGRLPSEEIFKDELAYRCRNNGMDAWREMAIRVTHGDFSKRYFMDLVVNRGVIYEAKTAERFVKDHDRQLIHYLLLAEQPHGKIVNFRNASVESKFISTRLTPADRRDFALHCQDWIETDDHSRRPQTIIQDLLEDWGAHLELALYREAILHFLGGEENLSHPVELRDKTRIIGRLPMPQLNPTTSLHLSAASKHSAGHEKLLLRLLHHTPLQAIQWINFNGKHIALKTLS